MAANNYFGFTHGGTQYAATGAAAYQPTQTGYAVPTAAAATYTTQRAAPTAYETAYQAAATHTTPGTYAVPTGTTAAATTYDYGYAARTAQTAYDTSKTYYQQPTAAAAAAAAAATYSTTDYQAAPKPSYSATYTTQTTRPAAQAAQKTSAYSTTYPTQQTQASNSYSSVYTSPVAQQQPQAQAKVVKKTYIPQQTTSVNTSVSTATFGGQAAAAAYNAQNTVAVTNNYSQSYTTPVSAPAPAVQAKPKTVATTTYSGYDAALYSAATMYVAQQAQPNTAVTTVQTTAQKTTTNTWQGYKKPGLGAGTGGMMKAIRQKLQPKPQQLHYCDVCKISCAGPQTYREHLEGQKHKKKEASVKAGSGPTLPRGGNALHCELCDVTCTGADAYAAHIRGAKHQKVVKLHTKLGKPIPSSDPKALGAKTSSSTTSTSTTTKSVGVTTSTVAAGTAGTTIKSEPGTDTAVGTTDSVKEDSKVEDVEMVPENEITPVGLEYIEEITNEEGKAITFNCKLCECRFNDPNAKEMHMKGRRHRLQFKKKVNPELVVDVKVTMRQKKIQEEKMRRQAMREEYFRRREEERANFWTDRMMEVEERIYWEERRRYEEELEYYEWCRRHHNVPHPRGMPIPPPLPGHPYGPPVGPPLMPPPPPSNFFAPGPPQTVVRRPDTSDDRHVISRHAAIYPKESELQAVQKIVSHTEKALKFVSDHLTDSNFNKPAPGAVKPGLQQTPINKSGPVANKPGVTPSGVNKPPVTPNKPGGAATPMNKPAGMPASKPVTTAPVVKQMPPPTTNSVAATGPKPGQPQTATKKDIPPSANKNSEPPKKEDGRDGSLFSFQREKEESGAGRILKGVMRVGVLAKGLLLSGDTAVSLVVLCAEKPSKSLLQKVYNNLPIQLKNVAPDEGYTVAMKPEDAAILVTGSSEPKITVTVTLTSPVVRESMIAESSGDGVGIVTPVAKDPPDVLNKQKCLDALAALRHAKWFQARATGLQSCVMVIRILRDLCQRNPTWTPLNSWAMELLAEKVLSSAGGPMPPGDALRRIMEALASGILLPGGPGLLDPCEKDPTDAAAGLTPQQREDITASAQHALRLMAFRQIHKVLGMEMLPAPKFNRSHHRFGRKRRRDNSSGEGNDSEAGDGKKDKKDGDAVVRMETDKSSK